MDLDNRVLHLQQMIVSGNIKKVLDSLRADPSLIKNKTPDGDMPIHTACWQKQIAIIGVLISYKPDLNARGCYGRTPLHYAVHEGRAISIPIVGMLLAMGANPFVQDNNGYSVEDWAKVEMYDGLEDVLYLIQRSAEK